MKKTFGNILGKSNKVTQVVTSVKFIVIVAVLLLVGVYASWKYHTVTDADRVFWGMVDTNLQTNSYTRQSNQKNAGQSVDQILATNMSPQQVVYAETVFQQTGVDAATAVTENIGTPTNDYVRYTSIETSQKSTTGAPLDFSKALNVWGVTESEDPSQTTGQLYNQSVLGIIPTGNVTAAQRREIIKIMRDQKAYEYSVTQTSRSWPFGRPTYKMQVTVHPVAYITALKLFARDVGLNHLESIDPTQYESAQQLTFEVSIDGWTHQMTESTQSQGSKNEVITGRNIKQKLPGAPTDTISVDELQTRLQSVQ